MNNWRPQLYKKNGVLEKADPAVVETAIRIADNIVAKNNSALPIFSLRHLSVLCEVNYHSLRAFTSRDQSLGYAYRLFRIRKRCNLGENVRMRMICIPCPDLLKTQQFIHNYILSNIRPHSASIAYTKGSNIKDAASVHCNSKWLIKLDIKDFFESISERTVYRVLRNQGYPALLSFEIARICTRVVPRRNLQHGSNWLNERSQGTIVVYKSQNIGSLPQGAPTSPLLANLTSFELDEAITTIAKSHGLIYTRYADDIALSTSQKNFSRKQASKVIQNVYSQMRQYGFSPNTTKASISPPGAKKVVLGLLVDGDIPRLQKEYKARIRQHIYYCLKENHGPIIHAKNKEFASVLGFKNHLRGLISYSQQIEPTFGQEMYNQFKRIEWPL